MAQHIHCLVNDCHYWDHGNLCKASEILVTADKFGDTQPESVDAKMAAELAPTPAGSCMSTCCKTYVTKGSGQAGADGITRLP